MAVVSKEQNIFLSERADVPSVEVAANVFPIQAGSKQLLRGISCKEIQNDSGNKPIGSHGRKSLLMWRAAVEGLLERAALFYTRDSDTFHTQELQEDKSPVTDFAGCYIGLDSVLRNGRNAALGDVGKRRWLNTKLFQMFLHGVEYGLFKRNASDFYGREMYDTQDAAWIILPPIMTTTEVAKDLFAQDITNDNALIDIPAAIRLFGSALEHFPCGSTFYGREDDALFSSSALGHRWVTPYCGDERLDSLYSDLSAFLLQARGLEYDWIPATEEDVSFRRRIEGRLAQCLNLFDLARIGLWLARSCYYANRREQPRQLFVHKDVARSITIDVGWSGESDFDISISDGSAVESTADIGRYAKYGYSEGEALVEGDGFNSRWFYSVASTLGGAINDYFYNPEEWGWVANYFDLVETRTIRDGEYSGQEGEFVWISGSRMAAFVQAVKDHGFLDSEKWDNEGSCSLNKSFDGEWTTEASGSAYFGDIDYPCQWAVDNEYICDSGQEWMFGIGYCEVQVGEGKPLVIYDALKAANGGAVKTQRQSAAASITGKYLADIWQGIGKIQGQRLLGSLQAMKDWMNGFIFAPDKNSPKYTISSIQSALIAARDSAEMQFAPFYCLVGVNSGDSKFSNWAGLYTADRSGASDGEMHKVTPEDGDVWGLYEIGTKAFTLPVWCRDFESSYLPYEDYSAQGEIESYIGAFNWAWKAIAHN